jgi:CubicO group peptidase (beta-lactamase class C family)
MIPARRTLALALLVSLVSLGSDARGGEAISAEGQAALSRYLAGAVERGDVPGVVALVVGRDGVLYQGAFGKRDTARNVDMSLDTVFRIASMTKPITSVAVMSFAEAGKLQLDDPISRYLPDFEDRPVIATFDPESGAVTTRPAKRAITIRHLLAHTSGIGYAFSDPTVSRLVNLTRKPEVELPLLHDPGERWTYGASTRVLGYLVETISGEPLDVFLRSRIFQPLKMSETSFVVTPEQFSRLVTLHRRVEGRLIEEPNPTTPPPNQVRGDGGLYSTAADYGSFLRMLLNEGSLDGMKLLGAASVRAMGENQIGELVVEEQPVADPARTRPFPLGAGRDTFGLGFQIAASDERFSSLRSPGSLSWAGINNTHFWIDPKLGIGAVVLMQVLPFYDEDCIRTLRGFEEVVYRYVQ